MSERTVRYDAARAEFLEAPAAIRKRPGMYIGSTSERGLHHLVFNVADRAVKETLEGRVGPIGITLTPDGGVRIADDGPGSPLRTEAGGAPGLEAQLTGMEAGAGSVGRHSVALDSNGTWLCVTNALSSRLTVEVRREGTRWIQEYARGIAVTRPTAAGPATGHGTSIAFVADPEIFGTNEFSFTTLAERFRELAFLNRGLDITLTDERAPDRPRSERFRFPGGARDFVAFLDAQNRKPVHPEAISFQREDPRMAATSEVALRWSGSLEEQVLSYANSRPTYQGGTHVVGFSAGLSVAVNTYARERGLLTSADPDLSAGQIGTGLTAVVSVKVDRPEFLGATRAVLGNRAVRLCVEEAVREHVSGWLETHPEQASTVIGRMVRGVARD
ncbi:DNA gyrase subunit B [Streptomyces sp. NPDC050392]|uniref:DNA gyrase subunit B n=1 Tax=Streptomyces sp. NPDC050392 TaxID=3155782 RepID=UPI00342A12F3